MFIFSFGVCEGYYLLKYFIGFEKVLFSHTETIFRALHILSTRFVKLGSAVMDGYLEFF